MINMPVINHDVDKLVVNADVPEKTRKIRSVVLSVIGAILLVADVVGMSIIKYINRNLEPGVQNPDTYYPTLFLEVGCIISAVLFFIAFIQHKKNIPFYIFAALWVMYLIYYAVVTTLGLNFV